ncbi:MAG TPA: hypothetical protein VN982_03360 [Candidatus Dormibacteraeota bacterium]|nr:hypothetical protein [Candidatus Dormibacteraeota bacterium]
MQRPHSHSTPEPKNPNDTRRAPRQMNPGARSKPLDYLYLALLTAGSLLVHGYHPGAEDSEIYIPGIKVLLNPDLYPFGREFFLSHAHMTFFPDLIAASIRVAHVPFDWMILLWHVVSIFLLLLASLQLCRLLFVEERAHWAAVTLLAALLTLPVAGTALYIVDQYLNPRAMALFAAIFATSAVLEKKYLRAGFWIVFAAAVHPLMAIFAASWIFFLVAVPRFPFLRGSASAVLPVGLSIKYPSPAYREIVQTVPYFFLSRWQWYEWLGIFAPLAILYSFSRIARKQGLTNLETVCRAMVPFGIFYFILEVIFTVPDRLLALARYQPLRSLQLAYVLLILTGGGLLGKWLLKDRVWPWLALCVPLCAGMFIAQRQLFPATPHIEWPGATPNNDWQQAFLWIRGNTPSSAIFALNPNFSILPGEDIQGFRAIAERSRVADALKDSSGATMFPDLPVAEHWQEQVNAEQGWTTFQLADFQRLNKQFGVTWVVLDQKGELGLDCRYSNKTLRVCRIP